MEGSELDVARLNMFLRTADRVYIVLKEFPSYTFDDIYDNVYEFPWEDYMQPDSEVLVDGKCVKSTIFAISATQKVVKKAIMNRLSDKYKTKNLSESGERFRVYFSNVNDKFSLMLNTSGPGLHKRGYRDYVAKAPIKETLASAMLMLSDFYYDKTFVDPFCGSGTFVIEAANIALNIAPGKYRSFDYTGWSFFDKTAYKSALTEAMDKEKDYKLDFYGSDIDGKAINLAERHAENAGLTGKIKFFKKDIKDFDFTEPFGTIVTNPPYGERLMDKENVNGLYKTLGKVYSKLDNWSLFLITSADGFERAFGRRADKNRKVFNSDLECRIYEYFRKEKYFRNGKKGENND